MQLHRRPLLIALLALAGSCSKTPEGPPGPVARHSSSIAISHDGKTLYVVNADADSVSIIDVAGRKLERQILLAPAAPALSNGRFTPAVGPRALALSPRDKLLYVAGERSGKLYAIDLTTNKVSYSVDVGSEPTGVLVAPDESAVFVSCSNEGTVVRVDATSEKVTATAHLDVGTSPAGVPIPTKPWALGWSNDGTSLYVSHFLAPSVSVLDPATLHSKATLAIPDVPAQGNKLLASGQGRALYDVVARPGTSGEIWVPHMMLATSTPQPDLDFESTAFTTISVLKGDGTYVTRMSENAMSVSSNNGQFGDIVSGPHSLDFTPDGKYALIADSASEDILAVDANGRVEATLLRSNPSTGHMLEGIVVSPDGKTAYVDQRNTGDVAVIAIDTSVADTITLTVDGAVIPRMMSDPMPPQLRHGQFLFNTANSDTVPITKNHWVACATCHPEGRSDAVTWRFKEGPRDTPSNAGGVSDTGFLFRTADRRQVADYFHAINDEQGGMFSTPTTAAPTDPVLIADMQDIQAYVNNALPAPVPPHTDPTLVARGKAIFNDPKVQCASCHLGPAYTDSGSGNPNLDLSMTPLLHDVGTCNTGVFPDVAHTDDEGHPRAACMFDTPTLRGIADSAPYLHDGSAATLRDVLENTRGKMGDISNLSSADEDALIEYLRSL
jgi:YVTN family beta-propeller protein